jgi:RHS repeat-associated protein
MDYTYDAAGRVTSVTDAENNTTTLSYQDAGCACSHGDRVRSLVTPDLEPGQAWTFDYDADGRLQVIQDPLGERERFSFNAAGDLVTSSDRADRPTTLTYDHLGRPLTVTDIAGRLGSYSYSIPTSTGWVGPTLYAQSQNGSPAPTSLTAALADGQYQVGTNVMGSGADVSHAELYRDPTFELAFWHQFDSVGRETWHTDRSARAISSTQPGPTDDSSPFTAFQTTYGYYGDPGPVPDVIETLDKYTPGRYYSLAYTRNVDFDIIDMPGFLGATKAIGTSITRDAGGRITGTQTRFGGSLYYPQVTLADGRLSPLVGYPGPAASSIAYAASGQVSTIQIGGVRQSLSYGSRGLLAARAVKVDTTDLGAFQYAYDQLGRNTRLIYPEGHERRQTFDALGRLSSRCYTYTSGGPERCYSATYDAVGNPKVLTDPDMRQEIDYDALDRVVQVRRFVPPDSGSPAYVERYAYNAIGGFSIYDNVVVDDRRPRVDGGGFAAAGIPNTLNGTAVGMDSGGRVTALGAVNFRYFGIDSRLQAISQGSSETRFAYDPLFRSVGSDFWTTGSFNRQGANAYLYVADEDNIAATDGSSFDTTPGKQHEYDTGISEIFIYDGLDQPLLRADQLGKTTTYYELDTLGNVRRIRLGRDLGPLTSGKPSGWDLGGYAYSAFGKQLGPSDPGGQQSPSSSYYQPFQWQGRPTLPNNLYDFRARVWSPDLGAFLQPDQYGYLTRGGTLWSWPGNNPFRRRDPSGRYWVDEKGVRNWEPGEVQTILNDAIAVYALPGLFGEHKGRFRVCGESFMNAGPFGGPYDFKHHPFFKDDYFWVPGLGRVNAAVFGNYFAGYVNETALSHGAIPHAGLYFTLAGGILTHIGDLGDDPASVEAIERGASDANAYFQTHPWPGAGGGISPPPSAQWSSTGE